MVEPEVKNETLIALLEERGHTVTQQEETLGQKVADLEDKIRELSEAPTTPEQQEQALAEQVRDHMNASLTRWHSPGGDDAA